MIAPLASVNWSRPSVELSASVARSATSPDGTPVPLLGFTLTVTETFSFCPCVIPVVGETDNVVVVPIVDALAHIVARLLAFSEPSPVARS